MLAQDKQLIIDVIKSCPDLQLCTMCFVEGFPDTRHMSNALNRGLTELELYYMTNKKSYKVEQIIQTPKVCVYYYNPETRHAIRLFGTMIIQENMFIKKKYWNSEFSAYGYTGSDDPNFILLHFVPQFYKFYIGLEQKNGRIQC